MSGRDSQFTRKTTARFSFFNRMIKKFADRNRVRGPTLKKKNKVYFL